MALGAEQLSEVVTTNVVAWLGPSRSCGTATAPVRTGEPCSTPSRLWPTAEPLRVAGSGATTGPPAPTFVGFTTERGGTLEGAPSAHPPTSPGCPVITGFPLLFVWPMATSSSTAADRPKAGTALSARGPAAGARRPGDAAVAVFPQPTSESARRAPDTSTTRPFLPTRRNCVMPSPLRVRVVHHDSPLTMRAGIRFRSSLCGLTSRCGGSSGAEPGPRGSLAPL
jgi:hypothetical protein